MMLDLLGMSLLNYEIRMQHYLYCQRRTGKFKVR